MRVQELREQRANRVAEMRGLIDGAEREKRDLNQNEAARFESLKGEVSGIETRIGQAETLATMERFGEAQPMGGGASRSLADLEARYSIGKALAEFNEKGKLTGAEGEYAAETRSGRKDSFSAPVSLFLGEKRYVGTTQPAGGPGGAMVATELGPLIDRPRPRLAVEQLGATVLTGLTGNLDLPRQKDSGTGYWVPEHGPTTGSDPTFDKVSMGPKTVTGRYEVTRRMMIQAPQIEQVLRSDLGWVLAQQLDLAAARGSGESNYPRGVTSTPGVRKVTPTFAGTLATIAELDTLFGSLVSAVEDADLTGGTTGFLAHPRVRATLQGYRDGNGQPIALNSFLRDYPMTTSTQLPANLGEATRQAAVIFGNWSDLIIGYWSSIDIMLNPYAKEMADRGGAYIHAFLDADVAVRHPGSFSFTDTFPTAFGASTPVA